MRLIPSDFGYESSLWNLSGDGGCGSGGVLCVCDLSLGLCARSGFFLSPSRCVSANVSDCVLHGGLCP